MTYEPIVLLIILIVIDTSPGCTRVSKLRTIQDYRPLQLERKIHERNLVINILRFHDVFLCVVPFQLGADTGSLRGGVDVGGIGFEPRGPASPTRTLARRC